MWYGIKPISKQGTERLVDKAIQYAIANDRDSITFVHKGNIIKFTEDHLKTGISVCCINTVQLN